MRVKTLLVALGVAAAVAAVMALVRWFDAPPEPAPVETIDHLPPPPPERPARAHPDGGVFHPHPDRVGLPPTAPPPAGE